MNAKKGLFAICWLFAAALMFAQLSDGQRRLLEIAQNEVLNYFRRYKPQAEISGEKVIGTAQYGKYAVAIEITAGSGQNFDIDIRSDVKESYIKKWKANLRKNITMRL
jgi:hypothetical protein